jgi:hypothetical protein
MISINLLKQISGNRGEGSGRGSGVLARALIIAAVGVVIVVAGVEVMHLWLAVPYHLPAISWRKAEPDLSGGIDTMPQAAPKKKEAAALPAPKPDTTRHDTVRAVPPAPTAMPVAVLRDTVRPKASPAPSAADTAVRPEVKAACDIAFADRVLSTLAGVIPDDIEFTAIAIDSFNHISLAGQSPSRESVGRLFSGLPEESFQIAPPPQSFIAPADGARYRFALESRVLFRGRAADTAVFSRSFAGDASNPDKISSAVSAFSNLFKANGFTLRGKPVRGPGGSSGACRRVRYSLAGAGTLPDLVAFVRAAHEARLLCAFRSLHVLAAGNGRVSIDADVDFIAGR